MTDRQQKKKMNKAIFPTIIQYYAMYFRYNIEHETCIALAGFNLFFLF